MKSVRLILPVLLVLFLAPAAFGDKLYLKNGNVLEGKLVRETATHYFFKMKGMGEQPIAKDQVLKVEKSRSAFDEYAEKRKSVAADDAEGHYQLGVWCEESGLRKEAKAEFEAAVAADPDHAGAREKLGFVNYEGEWMTFERRDEILAEIAKREEAALAALDLGDTISNAAARFSFQRPAGGFEMEEKSKTHYVFTGPVLGKAPVTIEFRVEAAGESLDDMTKSLAKAVKKDHEDAAQGEPKATKIGGQDGRLLAFTYVRDDLAAADLDMERHDAILATLAGNFRFTIESRAGYWERLKPFFERVTGTMKTLEKPPDYVSESHGFSLAFPDDTYVKSNGFGRINFQGMQWPDGTVFVTNKNNGASFAVFPGKKGDGRADATSLQTLRDSIQSIIPNIPFFRAGGNEKSVKVGGEDALMGDLQLPDARLGSGKWSVVLKGERYYRIVFLNFLGGMGQQYVEEDFRKFLDGFQLTD